MTCGLDISKKRLKIDLITTCLAQRCSRTKAQSADAARLPPPPRATPVWCCPDAGGICGVMCFVFFARFKPEPLGILKAHWFCLISPGEIPVLGKPPKLGMTPQHNLHLHLHFSCLAQGFSVMRNASWCLREGRNEQDWGVGEFSGLRQGE